MGKSSMGESAESEEQRKSSESTLVLSGEVFLGLTVLQKNGLDLKIFSQLLTEDGDYRAQRIISILNEPVSKYWKIIMEWEDFYLKYFNISVNLKEVVIPELPKNWRSHLRLLIIVPAISVDRVIKTQRKHFKVEMVVSGPPAQLSNVISKSGPYALWTIESSEPLRKLRQKSAEWAMENNISGPTLQERLIYGFKYWDETGTHIDRKHCTCCSSSRFANGFMPFVSADEDGEGITITQDSDTASYPVYGHREMHREMHRETSHF